MQAPRYSRTLVNEAKLKIHTRYMGTLGKVYNPYPETNSPQRSLGVNLNRNSHTYFLNNAPFPCTGCGVKFSNFQSKRWHEQTCPRRTQHTSEKIEIEIERVQRLNFDEDRRPLREFFHIRYNKHEPLPILESPRYRDSLATPRYHDSMFSPRYRDSLISPLQPLHLEERSVYSKNGFIHSPRLELRKVFNFVFVFYHYLTSYFKNSNFKNPYLNYSHSFKGMGSRY
jgi:hypothetical protein